MTTETRTEAETRTETVTGIRAGAVIEGRYRLEEELGRGGFAVTWRGVELASGRAVAVKVLSLRAVDHWRAVEAFEREARVLKSIDHPSIPKYIELIAPKSADSDVFIMVQALAPGRSLAQRLKVGWRPDERELKNIAERVLGALEYLHSLVPPLVHRDIKPANILLDDDGRVSLIDFGSVRDRLARESELGSIAGTFGYMAPEQLSGQAFPQSDLYSLGVTLIELATRRAPAELPQRELKLDFKRLTNLSPGIVRWLDRLVEPVPERRFASARAALEALYRGGLAERPLGTLVTEQGTAVVDETGLSVTLKPRPSVMPFVGAAVVVGTAVAPARNVVTNVLDAPLNVGIPTIPPYEVVLAIDHGEFPAGSALFVLLLLFAFFATLRAGLSSLTRTEVRMDDEGIKVRKVLGPIKTLELSTPRTDRPTLVGGRFNRHLMLETLHGKKRLARKLDPNFVLAIEARAKQQRDGA